MPHCTKCGAEVPAVAQFCQACGQPQPVTPYVSPAGAPVTGGLSQNAAAALSYALGWITGIIFLVIDKRPYVRFHAAQSIATFAGLHLIRILIGGIFGMGFLFGGYHRLGYGWGGLGLGIGLLGLLGLFTFVIWLVCIIKAASGERFMLPIVGPIAENLAK
jgi:uncharacterized membrane protein